jgi:hypothetical protein
MYSLLASLLALFLNGNQTKAAPTVQHNPTGSGAGNVFSMDDGTGDTGGNGSSDGTTVP